MAIMVDQGKLEYDDPISKHWPEFGQNGKDKLLIKDLMRHQGGLYKLHKQLKPEECLTENILKNSIGSVIETDTQIYPETHRRMYHAITRDWISNEIFRRVENNGKTMG